MANVSRQLQALSWWQRGLALIVLLVVVGFLLPSSASVEREVLIDNHRATVFALLNDFRQIEKWSPKTAHDPNSRVQFQGPRRGTGASISWDSQLRGHGTETITESIPHELVAMESVTDGGASLRSRFKLSEGDGGTHLLWTIERDFGANIVGRYAVLFLDGLVGAARLPDIENLKSMADALPRADFADLEVEHIVVEALDIAYLRTQSRPVAAEVSAAMGDAYFDVLGFIDAQGLSEAGAPLSISRAFDGAELVFDAAIPVRGPMEAAAEQTGAVKIAKTYSGNVIRTKHVGPYATLANTHDKITAYIAALGIQRNGDVWESYVSDPTRTSAAELVTYVYYPVATD